MKNIYNFKFINEKVILLSKIIDLIINFNINFLNNEDIDKILNLLYEDMNAFLSKDPSTKGNGTYILLSFSSFDAVIGYRLSNYILKKYDSIVSSKKISEYIKVKTGIEIHPSCTIGRRFVIDHGVGTVIGETCLIGDDCYFLQNVILGSSKIAYNEMEQRHPIIGNNVELGGFVRIFGNVRIGNNVKVSPHSVIRTDIPNNHTVIIKSNEQKLIDNEKRK